MVERRLTWLAAFVLLWGAAIFQKLISLEVVHHREYADKARNRQEQVIEIPAPRGAIFDRTGQALAMSVPTESVYVNPLKVPNLDVASDLLALALHMDRVDLYGKMKQAHDTHRGFYWVKRKISYDEGQTLRNLHQDWIQIQSESQRHYPGGKLAAHVLGAVDFSEQGNSGIEKSLDADLRGTPGRLRLMTDVKRRGIEQEAASDAKPGMPVVLSIDERLQFVAEREIAKAVDAHHAASGSVVAMNPYTGEILALASYPTFDPNLPPQPGENAKARLNHAVSVPFEPGSVFKVMTLSAALETTNLRPDSPINCLGGQITLFGRTIHDSHVGEFGVIPMAMVLAHSSNVGAIQVGLRVGQENLYEYVHRFGFGQRSGIQLPAESPGRLRKLNRWGKTSLASIAMGQEVSVTTLQLAQAASIIANGGMLVHPRLVLKKGNQTVAVTPSVRVIRPETAITMRQMMEGVVLYGTGRNVANLQGYSSGGKTGSAQIFDFATKHYTHTYNGSFMGFAPVTNPAIVVVVTVNGTHGDAGFGGPTAGPVFQAVTTEALRLLDVPKDLPDEAPNTLVAKNDSFADLSDADADSDEPNILEDPEEEDAQPVEDKTAKGPKVPNFRGMTMRAVLAEAASRGLTILPDGSGVARIQHPAPGARLHEGERIRVQFVR